MFASGQASMSLPTIVGASYASTSTPSSLSSWLAIMVTPVPAR